MLKFILGATGHGKINHALNETIKSANDKKVLIISYELTTGRIVSRISKILNFYNHVSPKEIRIIGGISLSEMSICKDYDVVSFLGWMPPFSDKFSLQTATESYKIILTGMNEMNSDKLILATIQTVGGIGRKLGDVRDKFFSSGVETSDNLDHVYIFRDPKTDKFNVMSFHNKTVDAYSQSEFFLD